MKDVSSYGGNRPSYPTICCGVIVFIVTQPWGICVYFTVHLKGIYGTIRKPRPLAQLYYVTVSTATLQ